MAVTTVFYALFLPAVIVAVFAALGAVDYWLFVDHGSAQSVRQILLDPLLMLMVLALVVLSAAFHECGHATATRYGGARPGTMGVGIYIVWPAFYTDITDSYRLGKVGRLRADLGGVYFNVVFILGTAAAYFATGFEPLLVMIPLQHVEIAHQFLPFLRLDGYYIISDLTGVGHVRPGDAGAHQSRTAKATRPASGRAEALGARRGDDLGRDPRAGARADVRAYSAHGTAAYGNGRRIAG